MKYVKQNRIDNDGYNTCLKAGRKNGVEAQLSVNIMMGIGLMDGNRKQKSAHCNSKKNGEHSLISVFELQT